jgi:hypothetical protein
MSSPAASVTIDPLVRGANGARAAPRLGETKDLTNPPVRLTTACLSSIEYEPVVWIQADRGQHTDANGAGQTVLGQSFAESLPTFELGRDGRTPLDQSVRAQASELTGLKFKYINQLVSFLAPPVLAEATSVHEPQLTIGYMVLVHTPPPSPVVPKPHATTQNWVSCYAYLPWEDWRAGRPAIIEQSILPSLSVWARAAPSATTIQERQDQITLNFGAVHSWDDERVLERYELMRAAGLFADVATPGALGRPLPGDHRLVLAAALGRLRSKLRYRPVVFELMAPEFTLFELQRTVEGIIGPHLHKQNFRRLVETMGLVEATGEIKNHTGGRPAKLFRFRAGVVLEQQAPGMRVRLGHV